MNALFVGGADTRDFPDRFGYYVGLRVAEELGTRYELRELANMPPERVKTAVKTGIDRLISKAGGCH